MDINFNSITCCLDMYGCPNRCKHCWLGCTPNGNLEISELYSLKKEFEAYTQNLEIFDWYREPDYKNNYQELWKLSQQLSTTQSERKHYELISFWRLVRDETYVKWLNEINLKIAQLTIFGTEETTDYFIGRKGAYKEILQSIEILIEHKISPRLQLFLSKRNVEELNDVVSLITNLDLVQRCRDFGGEFSFFLHQGSCDGENAQHYDVRVTPTDLAKIPQSLIQFTLKHFSKTTIEAVFGCTEQHLYNELIHDHSTASYAERNPVFYIDKDFFVYPNISAPSKHWCLGNIKNEGTLHILEQYVNNASKAQFVRYNIPLSEIVQKVGNSDSKRLFTKNDYITYLINQYCLL